MKNNWNLNLKYFRFKDVFKEGMIGEDVDIAPYIADKTLIESAEQLQDELKKYMQFVC